MQLKQSDGDLGQPGGDGWSSVASEDVALAPMPLESQPTAYIRTSWADREYGTVRSATVQAAHDGSRAYVRIEWADPSAEKSEFRDAAGVYFRGSGDAPAATIGDESSPVTLWQWKDGLEGARALDATGPGRFHPSGGEVDSAASLDDGRWSVVLSGALSDLDAEALGVGIWDGSNEERAGIGSATAQWLSLEIDK